VLNELIVAEPTLSRLAAATVGMSDFRMSWSSRRRDGEMQSPRPRHAISAKKPVSSFVPLGLRAYYAEREQIENAKAHRTGQK
jgi:hypothetical protein